jgi:acetyl-CoA carboxylase biotin carboxyl carrier protein
LSERKQGKRKGAEGAGKSTATGSSGPMDVSLLEQIVRLMSANDLNTVDLRDGGKRVVLKRGTPVVHYTGNPISGTPQGATSAPQAPAAPPPPSAEAAQAAADAKLVPIKSPMVGTFYAAPKQGEKPYVSPGSTVNEETDVCIIEAMKVFNVIKAETSGTIAKVMIQDGQPVEHGTVLFLVKPA